MSTSKTRKSRLLLIEDNSADVELLRLALHEADVECDLVVLEDGGQALEFVRGQGKYLDREAPDLTILDLNLPRNDGIEVLEEMRLTPLFAQTRVAVLSSSSLPRERARLESLQVSRFIMKPCDVEEFLHIGVLVRELLAGAEETEVLHDRVDGSEGRRT